MGIPPAGQHGYGQPVHWPGQQHHGYGQPHAGFPGHGFGGLLPPDQAARQMRRRRRRRWAALFVGIVAALPIVAELAIGLAFGPDLTRYGVIPFPGSGSVTLPRDEVAVTFQVSGFSEDLDAPELDLTLFPADGGPPVVERVGESLFGVIDYTARSVSTDAYSRAQIGTVDVPRAGPYRVKVTPREASSGANQVLAFGEHRPIFHPLPLAVVGAWLLAGLLICTLLVRPRGGYVRGLLRLLGKFF